MQIQRQSRTLNDSIFTAGTNVHGTTLTTGMGVALAIHAASVSRGATVLKLTGAAADMPHFLGVADQDIAANAVGRVVIWGYAASVMISTSIADHTTIVPGEPMVPGVTLDGAFVSAQAPAYASSGFKYVLNMITVNVSTNGPTGASWTSGFVKGGL
jgi:hypothetical protein